MSTPLAFSLNKALTKREQASVPVQGLNQIPPSSAPDLFSNDYLSLATNTDLRHSYLEKLSRTDIVLGTSGSRVLGGNPAPHVQFEARMKEIFSAPSALLFNSGYDANLAFWQTVPQSGDAIIMDEFVHASIWDGVVPSRIKQSRYTFAHNSLPSLRKLIADVLETHPNIAAGKGTLFIAVETLYSMDGDFAPLKAIVQLARELIPEGSAHIVVDGAHTTGMCGPRGRGLVMALGLEKEVDTVVHVFSKARALNGAVLLIFPIIRKYLINYARPFIYSTSMPHSSIVALNASFDHIESSDGAKPRDNLYQLSCYFKQRLAEALKHISPSLLRLAPHNSSHLPPGIASPLIPIFSNFSLSLANFLQNLGYNTHAVPYPAVPQGQERIRVTVHAANTEEELNTFIVSLLIWAKKMEQ